MNWKRFVASVFALLAVVLIEPSTGAGSGDERSRQHRRGCDRPARWGSAGSQNYRYAHRHGSGNQLDLKFGGIVLHRSYRARQLCSAR